MPEHQPMPVPYMPQGCTLLGISGKIAAGKDTIGNAIMERLGGEYGSVSFGDPLKSEVQTVISSLPTTPIQLSMRNWVPLEQAQTILDYLDEDKQEGILKDTYTKTPGVRKALQYWGTDIRRKQDEHYWLKAINRRLQKAFSRAPQVLVPDIRFPNELEFLRGAGFFTLRLEVSPETQLARLKERDKHAVLPQHASETALDDSLDLFSMVVRNEDRSVEDIADEVCEALRAHQSA